MLMLQLGLPSLALPDALSPDFLLIGIVWMAARSPGVVVLIAAWSAGMLEGSFAAFPVGATAAAKVLVAYALVGVYSVVDSKDTPIQIALVGLASVVNSCLLFVFPRLLGVESITWPSHAISRALVTAGVAVIVIELASRLSERPRRGLAW